jgi:hypothetical protein
MASEDNNPASIQRARKKNVRGLMFAQVHWKLPEPLSYTTA